MLTVRRQHLCAAVLDTTKLKIPFKVKGHMYAFIQLMQPSKIQYHVKLHQNLNSSYHVILSSSKIKVNNKISQIGGIIHNTLLPRHVSVSSVVFTVRLHVMQHTVLLSEFCPSVRPSDACIVTKLNNALRIF